MSPTLKNSVRVQFLSFVVDSSDVIVPVGLHVGREADHTALLEATAEGILLVAWLAMFPTTSTNFLQVRVRSRWSSSGMEIRVAKKGLNVPECRRGDRTSEA